MAKILHIQASPREGAFSKLAAEAYLAAHLAKHPGDVVETIDVWTADLPEFDGPTLQARYAAAAGKEHSAEQAKSWGAIVKQVEHFKGFDAYVVSFPMWNFSVPYRLKQYIDVLAHPGLTFGRSPEKGFFGLVTGKPVTIFVASAGDYRPGAPAAAIDFATPYVEWMFKFFGFTDIRTLRIGPTVGTPDAVEAVKTQCVNEARALVV